MELEERIQELEEEMNTLKLEIQNTLVEIQESLPEKTAAPVRWEKKAWMLALLNLLLALVLFTNIPIYVPGGAAFGLDPTRAAWLRAFWIAIAFMWLLLQMYPLALLLEQEDRMWQGIVWRNAVGFLRAQPGLWVLLTLVVLVVAIVNIIIPAAWLIVALALLVAMTSFALRNLLELFQKRGRAH